MNGDMHVQGVEDSTQQVSAGNEYLQGRREGNTYTDKIIDIESRVKTCKGAQDIKMYKPGTTESGLFMPV